MEDCIFCKIAQKAIPTEPCYEDEHIFVLPDINPVAPIHWLVIPKVHFSSIVSAQEETALLGHLFSKLPEIAKLAGVSEDGFRMVVNTGENGGQTVDHLHIHLLGGRAMTWPPG